MPHSKSRCQMSLTDDSILCRQISINVNAMSLVWYTPLIIYEIWVGGLLSSPFLLDVEFWTFNFATVSWRAREQSWLTPAQASVGFVLNVAAMLQAPLKLT